MRTPSRWTVRLAVAFLPATIALPATAQQAPRTGGDVIAPGARVRVTQPGMGRRIGTVVSLTSDSLVARWAGGGTAAMPFAAASRIEVSRGRRSRPWRGAGLGFLAGAVTGGAYGHFSYDEPEPGRTCNDDGDCWGRGLKAVEGAFAAGAIGAAAGLVLGITLRSETWRRVPTTRVGLAAPASGRGAGAALSF